MSIFRKTIVRTTSKNRYTNEPICNFNVYLKQKLQNVIRIVPHSATIPNTFYNVNTFDNSLNILTDAMTVSVALPVGYYNLTTGSPNNIVDSLRTLIQVIDPNLTITYNPSTYKISITHATLNITVLAGTLNESLGYPTTGQGSLINSTEEAINIVDLRGVTEVFVHLSFIENGHFLTESRDNLNSSLNEDVICRIPITSEFGFTSHWENNEEELLSVDMTGARNISYFRIYLTDEDNNILDTNGLNWTFHFVAYE